MNNKAVAEIIFEQLEHSNYSLSNYEIVINKKRFNDLKEKWCND